MSELWLHGILNRPSSAPLVGPRQPLVQSEHGSRRSWKVALSRCLHFAACSHHLVLADGWWQQLATRWTRGSSSRTATGRRSWRRSATIGGRGSSRIIGSLVAVLPVSRGGLAPQIWPPPSSRCQLLLSTSCVCFQVRECQLLVARNEAEAHTTLMDEYIRAVYRLPPEQTMQ